MVLLAGILFLTCFTGPLAVTLGVIYTVIGTVWTLAVLLKAAS